MAYPVNLLPIMCGKGGRSFIEGRGVTGQQEAASK